MKAVVVILSLMFIYTSCENKTKNITIKKTIIEKEIKLPLPDGRAISANLCQFVNENGMELVLVYYYPQSKIFVYDIENKEIINEIPVYKNLAGIDNFRYINKDSIWVFGYSSLHYNFDSSLMVIDIKGKIKHLYPFYHNYFMSLKTYPNLYSDSCDIINENALDTVLFCRSDENPNDLYIDNRVFFTTMAGNIGKKPNLPKLPIVGCYNLKSKRIELNSSLYYPYFCDSMYYPKGYMYNYYPIYWSVTPDNKILLSFRYTPTIFEWDYRNDKVKTHQVKTQLIDSIYAFSKPMDTDNDTMTIYNNTFYAPNIKMYLRCAMLSNRYDNKYIIIFTDDNFNYMGETITDVHSLPLTIYKNSFVSWYISGDSLVLRFFHYDFEPLDINKLKHRLDSIKHIKLQQTESEVCGIAGQKSTNYSEENFLKYLGSYGIKDSSFAVVILSKKGCHSCNDYVAQNISINQHVFFNLPGKPFYLLYLGQNENKKTVEHILSEYGLNMNDKIKIDTSTLYPVFNPYSIENPRLILVNNKKFVSDTVYLPDNLKELMSRLIDYYDFETE